MTTMSGGRARSVRGTVSWAVLACALAAGHGAWGQEAATTATTTTQTDQAVTGKKKPAAIAKGEEAKDATTAVSEFVVTGTNIRGIKPIGPLQVITREDIDHSGYADIGDVIRSLPEDFAGGQNPGDITYTGINDQNITNGSSVNLFGLGSDATLTLLNGHRMPGDGFYQGADISVIPLGAIERVEAVTDGSSALYGSDAVAGVVNFILRRDYNGLETSAYYGGATEGGGEDQIYSLLGGISKDHWHFLLSGEYEHENPITASERDFSSTAYGPETLIQGQSRKTVFVSGGVDITDHISFSVDGLYSNRVSNPVYGETGVYSEIEKDVSPNYNVSETLDIKIPRDWDLRIIGTQSADSINAGDNYVQGSFSEYIDVAYRNELNSVEATANGKVVKLPTGDLDVALGGGYRQEGFDRDYPGQPAYNALDIHSSRDVTYVYGEAFLPLVQASASRLGMEELTLSASGRYEHYSDFGNTANPKVGIRYIPFNGLSLRGSWGTSFKAPSFLQEFQPAALYYYPITECGGQGTGTCLLVTGGNPNLKPERSRNWTIGADYKPAQMGTMVISVTYFNIDYRDRIVNPLLPNSLSALSNPVNSPFVTLDPSAAMQSSVINAVSANEFYNETGQPYDASKVGAIALDSYQNAVSQVDHGIDVSYRQTFSMDFGDIRTFANATWIHQTEQVSPVAPVQTLSGTIYNVPNFRARGGASWSKYGLTATAIVNFTSSETNTGITPSQQISSLTTVDANLSYKFPEDRGIGRGLSIALLTTNLFDHQPPYAKTTFTGLNFDSLNASVIGRFVAFKIIKKW